MNGKLDKYTMRTKRKSHHSESSEENEESVSINLKSNIKLSKKRSRQRQENSLGELTKNFIDFIKSQGDKLININDVVRKLKVKKRRIYDITNVLEGIGYLVKKGKNKIEWIKEDSIESNFAEEEDEGNREEMEDIEALKKEIKELKDEENHLDKMIDQIKTSFENLNEDKNFKEFGYVTFDDIKSLTKNQNTNVNLIAIKAPSGTSVEIPDPEHIEKIYLQTYENMKQGKEEYNPDLLESLSKKHQIFLDSQSGEIMCYLVLNKNEEENLQRNDEDVKQNLKNYNRRASFNNFGLDQSLTSNLNFGNSSQVLQSNNSFKNIQNYYSDTGMII